MDQKPKVDIGDIVQVHVNSTTYYVVLNVKQGYLDVLAIRSSMFDNITTLFRRNVTLRQKATEEQVNSIKSNFVSGKLIDTLSAAKNIWKIFLLDGLY